MSRQPNPLKLRLTAGPKRYAVVVQHTLPSGQGVTRPLDRHGRLGAFPDHAGSRWQARKLLRRVLGRFPSAQLWKSRKL
jgi:hypothetical protein